MKSQLHSLLSIILVTLAYVAVFQPDGGSIALDSALETFSQGDSSLIEFGTAQAHLSITGTFLFRSLSSNEYISRCNSPFSSCSPEFFYLSIRGEMIHGSGESPEKVRGHAHARKPAHARTPAHAV